MRALRARSTFQPDHLAAGIAAARPAAVDADFRAPVPRQPRSRERARPIIGLTLLENLKPEDAGFAGEIYNADEGKMYAQFALALTLQADLIDLALVGVVDLARKARIFRLRCGLCGRDLQRRRGQDLSGQPGA
jgi:hypothetical protein